ncbi:glycosyltransferase family 22 protein [Suhomyces tanzawaensis NRRL Y-17324]|uniref:Mannosyltransferase n=1 Tax=Suhomyces tanzawaensis NRRL Y-17324 TaxID=984487 RepID=A0A1E4SGY7_9ASCO|nr:glycosyltransferase family 22 protein [Suhomyces tanzawaensis NRRL Y-17324]ODV78756.1 glycosyltransferase family 22 protein [Suhomyces tanzawaensis NRRL Y-17324]
MSMEIRNRARKAPKQQPTLQKESSSSLAVGLFIIRIANSLTITTYFQPDEYFQALEVAHHYVFGYGFVTWEWKEHLRSAIHPLIYALGYKTMLAILEDWIQVSPKIVGALMACIGDVAAYLFFRNYTRSEQLARIGLVLWVLNPFNWYVLTRAFSNSFETVLTIVAWVYWPWDSSQLHYQSYVCALGFAFVSCIVRPTNAIIWACLGVNLLLKAKKPARIIVVSAIELVVLLGANCLVDYAFYGSVTFPLYNFLEFNVVRNLSVFYGVAPWHFYLFQGIPLMMMLYLPFLLVSLYKNYRDPLVHSGVIVLIGFSLIDHKEFRFIYPLQPLMILQCAYAVKEALAKWPRNKSYFIFGSIALLHLMVAFFFTRVNERGVIDLIGYMKSSPEIDTVGFLTPCHSTPWQSYLHDTKFESSWFLTCEPPLTVPIEGYRDESDQFYDDPIGFMEKIPDSKWPSHLVIFEALKEDVDEYLANKGYSEKKRFFNSFFHWDDRRKGDVIVYQRSKGN